MKQRFRLDPWRLYCAVAQIAVLLILPFLWKQSLHHARYDILPVVSGSFYLGLEAIPRWLCVTLCKATAALGNEYVLMLGCLLYAIAMGFFAAGLQKARKPAQIGVAVALLIAAGVDVAARFFPSWYVNQIMDTPYRVSGIVIRCVQAALLIAVIFRVCKPKNNEA